MIDVEQMTLPPAFAAHFDAQALAIQPSTLVAIAPDGLILWFNGAWGRFARANAGETVLRAFRARQSSYYTGIADPLRSYFERAFGDAYAKQQVFDQDYECSSEHVMRTMHLRALPIPDGGLLLEHSQTCASPMDRTEAAAIRAKYVTPAGLIVQCSNCRKVRRSEGAIWDWIPSWLSSAPTRVSHGVCEVCLGFYYGLRW